MNEDQKERALILLKAMRDLMKKSDETPFVTDIFQLTAVWDGAECDGGCLYEELTDLLDDIEYS